MIPCRSNISKCDWFMTTGERQLQFQSRYHMGRSLTLPLCLLVLAGNNGVAITPWVALPAEYTPDVHHPLLQGTSPCRVEATNRSKGVIFFISCHICNSVVSRELSECRPPKFRRIK
ncbi:hypothetical protein AVEN_4542-1 [Araneus ventricosus]|uniref:Uncharacterized protein n=1 Tax=Araneus ventricosus TaxID=182803 RepID=A0A4Y2BL90_ARAVE|nr:hypothetical protein AVEN_4542-1 [Araneus ventricosus]